MHARRFFLLHLTGLGGLAGFAVASSDAEKERFVLSVSRLV